MMNLKKLEIGRMNRHIYTQSNIKGKPQPCLTNSHHRNGAIIYITVLVKKNILQLKQVKGL